MIRECTEGITWRVHKGNYLALKNNHTIPKGGRMFGSGAGIDNRELLGIKENQGKP